MQTTAPLVTIGLPVYNGARTLGEALDSLLAQTYPGFELVLSDNGSTDETESMCRRYAARDERIRYCRSDRNRGAAWNFRRVVELARGSYFKWAAHDDLCASRFLECCVGVLEREPSVVLCYPKTMVIDEQGAPVRESIQACALRSARASHRLRQVLEGLGLSDPMFGVTRTEVLRSTPLIGPFPGSDTVLLAELALRGEVYEWPERLFFRRDHGGKSNRAHPTLAGLASWYDPENDRRLVLPTWRRLRGHIASIARVPMPRAERAACLWYMARWVRWNAPELGVELRLAAVRLMQRTHHRRPSRAEA